jgi:hypothetical protein
MNARTIIEGAFRLIGITQADETPTASEMSDGLATLNDMLHEWPLDFQHEDLTLSGDLRMPPNHLKGIRYNLAVELAPEYGKTPSPAVAAIASNTAMNLRNEYANPARLNTRQFGDRRYDIERDS